MGRVAREPAIAVGVVVSAITALITLTNAFGLLVITDAQRDAILACVVALWPVLLIVRQLVTPVAAAVLPVGSDLNGGTATVVTRA